MEGFSWKSPWNAKHQTMEVIAMMNSSGIKSVLVASIGIALSSSAFAGNVTQVVATPSATAANFNASSFASTSDLNSLRNQVNLQLYSVNQRLDRVGAMGAAMSQMAFSTQGINTPNRLGMGIGGYGGQAAMSVGYAYQITPKANLTYGAAISSGGESSGGVGLGVGW